MTQDFLFIQSINFYYASLSASIENRISTLKLKRKHVLPTDPSRVSKIKNNTRSKKHPYLIGTKEYKWINLIFMMNNKEDIIQAIRHYDEASVGEGLVSLHEDSDSMNYDDLLWGHIDWEKLYVIILEDLNNIPKASELGSAFMDSLLDYVPFAIDVAHYEYIDKNHASSFFESELQPYYEYEVCLETSEIAHARELVHGDEMRIIYKENYSRAVEWVFMRDKISIVRRLKETFLNHFRGKRLQKFDHKFENMLKDFMFSIIKEKMPSNSSFGLQAYNYVTDINDSGIIHLSIPLSHTSIENIQKPDNHNAYKSQSNEIDLVDHYLDYVKNHLQKLESFQLLFDQVLRNNSM